MSKILNKASLLLNPAGSSIAYKEGEILSVLPNDGSGDWNRTGGEGGTRISQDGYIERTPHNLYPNSNGFDQSPWSKTGGTTLTSGQPDPLGGNEAWRVDMTSGASNFLYGFSDPRASGVVTISAYLRADSTTTIGFNDGAGNPNSVTIGTTWQRYTFTYTVVENAGGTLFSIIQIDNYFGVSPAQEAKTFYLYGAQLNPGPTARPYQPTTDRLNYPRISYTNGRGALLTEPARTNLSNNSVTGTYGNSPGSTTLTISPDGTNNATVPVPNSLSDRYQITIFGGSYSSGTRITYSWHYKQLGPHNGSYASEPGGLSSTIGIINLNRIGDPEKLYDLPDGWSRWKITYEIVDGSIDAIVRNYFGYVIGIGYSTAAYYGHQYEIGSFATSYIPTNGSQVTRVDEYSSNITSFQSTGVVPDGGSWSFYIEGDEVILQDQGWMYFGNGTYLGGHYGTTYIYKTAANTEAYPFSVTQPRFRIGASWDGTNLVIYQNGQERLNTTDVLSNYNNFSQITVGSGNSKCSFPTIAVFPEHLSSADLQELTTFNSGSGGDISYYGPYTIHTFTSSGTFTPSFTGDVEVLVVAGGGGGGANHAGGGGAGGFHEMSSYSVSQGNGVTITIGAGGSRSTQFQTMTGYNGGSTSFGNLSVLGGGGGGNRQDGGPANLQYGKGGGSGGGSGGQGSDPTPNLWPGGAAIPGIGNPGGAATYHAGGGGGGAGEAGSPGTTVNGSTSTTFPGDGGDGLPSTITGLTKYFAGGGGGGGWIGGPNVGDGGIGGGGKGKLTAGSGDEPEVNGVPNTGGGGGGAAGGGLANGGNGGSGIVIIKYLT